MNRKIDFMEWVGSIHAYGVRSTLGSRRVKHVLLSLWGPHVNGVRPILTFPIEYAVTSKGYPQYQDNWRDIVVDNLRKLRARVKEMKNE